MTVCASSSGQSTSKHESAPAVSRSPRRSDQPATVLLHDFAVAQELPARAQVLDHVPVDDALVLAAERREAGADREMHRAVDLLVEQRVLHVALDAGVAADPELAEDAGAVVAVERLEEDVLAAAGRGLDDAAASVDHPDSFDLVRLLEGRELGKVDDAFGRVLDRAEVDLATRQVRVAGVDLALAAFEAERQVRARADDPDLRGTVEPLLDLRHPLALGIPVAQAGPIEEVLELGERHPRVLGERRCRESAGDPRDLIGEAARAHRVARLR